MAILPGSLDYLYYNGIIDHIPCEAYEMTPMTPSGIAQMSGMSGLGFASQCPYHANVINIFEIVNNNTGSNCLNI